MARKIYNHKIVDAEFPNVGIAIEDGKKIKIKGAIQGQKVETVSRRKVGENYSEKLYSLLEESSLEKTVGCIHMKDCGGCVYQALKYEDEFLYKSRQIEKLFENFGVDIQKIKAKCEKFYRNKMEYTFGDEYKGSELALGMHKKNRFYEIVNTENCQIVHEDFNLIQVAVRNYFRKIGLSFLHKRTGKGNLRHLVIRRSSLGEILINLVVTSDTDIDREEFIKMLLGLKLEGKIESVFLTRNDSVADAVIPEKVELIYGREYIFEEIFNLKFKITPFSFFQTNTESAEILYKTAIGFLENLEEKTVFDLYSGVGTISQIIAKKAKFVIGIEIVEEAIESAKNSAKFNGIENVEFIAGDVLKKIDEIDLTPDVIILDPPREGINPKALKKITEISPENILYISCNPKTLARDLQDFLKTGYKIEKMAMIDQFPKTANVEAISFLKK